MERESPGRHFQFFPLGNVTDIPFLFPSGEIAWKVLDGPFGDRLRAAFLKERGCAA